MRNAPFNDSAAEALIFDVCWASTSMVNPDMTRRFVLPEIQWAMANVKPGKKKGLFLSGRMRDILPMLVETGAEFIETLDALGDCDLAEVKRAFGDRVCLMGNFNCVVLAHGTVDDARRETLRCLDAAMAGGGYILSTSDEVPADAKLENMKAMAQIVGQHGRY